MSGFDSEAEEQEVYRKIQRVLNPISEEVTNRIGDLIEELHEKHGDDIGFETLITIAERALLGMKCTFMCHMDMNAKREVEEEEGDDLGLIDFSDN